MRISPIVVGAVIVGFGTGAPELLVSSVAAARGSLDLAIGNVVGSNMANVTLVLGVAGIIAKPAVVPRVIRREAPLALASVILLAVLVQGGLTRREGLVLIVGLIGALGVMLRSTEETAPVDEQLDASPDHDLVEETEEFIEEEGEELGDIIAAPKSRDLRRVVVGLVATVAGAQVLVVAAQRIAEEFDLSGGFVGITLVAIGTSLPELVTAIQSARRHETALLAGNVLGSNIFNSTAVAGAAALIGPGRLDDPGLTTVACGAMVGIAALAWIFLGAGGRLRRWEGLVLVAVYVLSLGLTA